MWSYQLQRINFLPLLVTWWIVKFKIAQMYTPSNCKCSTSNNLVSLKKVPNNSMDKKIPVLRKVKLLRHLLS